MLSSGGANELAQVIAERIAGQTQRPDALELGVIQDDMGLKLDRFAVPIPVGEYLLADFTVRVHFPAFSLIATETCMEGDGKVTLGASVDSSGSPLPGSKTRGLTKYSFLPRQVPDVRLEIKPELGPGDRVLVAWVNDGTDPVIVSKVVSS